MQTVKVEVRGIAPLLMNKYPMPEAGSEDQAKRKDEKYSVKTDADKLEQLSRRKWRALLGRYLFGVKTETETSKQPD